MRGIDLFAGGGGFSIGFTKNGFEIVKAVEFDKQIANTYLQNHPEVNMIVDDIKNVVDNNMFKRNESDIIIGGPPCQGFSMAGARIRDGFIDDERNYLFKHYVRAVKAILPKIFIMENVKGIKTMQNGKIFNEILNVYQNPDNFEGHKYNIYYKVLNAKDFGVPQARERMIIVGVRDVEIDFENELKKARINVKKQIPTYFNPVTVWDAISNLGKATEDGIIEMPIPTTDYQKYLYCKQKVLYNHSSTKHSDKAIERMKKINENENFMSLDEKINSVHSGSYGRLSKAGVAPTITTRFDTPSGGRFIHPVENRTLTPREAARIQSFPDSYRFFGSKTSIHKQIGNAVPPKLSFVLAKMVKNIINEYFEN